MTRPDAMILGVAAIGLALWYMTETAMYALMVSITISLMGGMLTIQKTYWFPNSETMITWHMSFVAACFAVLAVGAVNWVLLAYPIYLLILNGAIIGAWTLGRMPQARRRQAKLGLFVSSRAR
ncbi:MAG: hypothetical protein ACSHXH_14990 [Marivita sp.]|uniref:hypothetical protein n=1 Tax=Marivita sp. TaxID=2003365 RepID=UPI003EF3190C